MKNEKFEQAKQAVANDLKFGSWNEMFGAYLRLGNFNPPTSVAFLCEKLEEAYQLVAERLANEAVKADRKSMVDESAMAPDNESFIDYQHVGYHDNGAKALDPVISKNILNRPLPFPQQPDKK